MCPPLPGSPAPIESLPAPPAPLSPFLTASPQPLPEALSLHFLPPTLPPFSPPLALSFLHDFSYRSGHVLLLPSTLSSRARTCPIRSCYELMLLACQAAQTKASGVDYQSRSPCPARRGCTNGTGSSLGRGARALLPYTGVQRTAAPERLRSVRCCVLDAGHRRERHAGISGSSNRRTDILVAGPGLESALRGTGCRRGAGKIAWHTAAGHSVRVGVR